MKQVLFTMAAAAVLLAGCQTQAPPFTEAERASVVAEIMAVRDAYFDAATHFDIDTLAAFWHKDFIHVQNNLEAPVTVEMLREAWKPLSHIEMDIHADRVIALSRDSGYTMRFASYVVYDAEGAAVGGNDWAGTHIWVRTDAGWKVHAVHEGRPTQQ